MILGALRCTTETIAAVLGWVPLPGSPPIVIPESRVIMAQQEHGRATVTFAKACARLRGIRYTIKKGE